jgi:hypothetical protein
MSHQPAMSGNTLDYYKGQFSLSGMSFEQLLALQDQELSKIIDMEHS